MVALLRHQPGALRLRGWYHLVVPGDVPCAPCYLSRCPIGQLCMERITPAMVVERVEQVLSGAAERHEWYG